MKQCAFEEGSLNQRFPECSCSSTLELMLDDAAPLQPRACRLFKHEFLKLENQLWLAFWRRRWRLANAAAKKHLELAALLLAERAGDFARGAGDRVSHCEASELSQVGTLVEEIARNQIVVVDNAVDVGLAPLRFVDDGRRRVVVEQLQNGALERESAHIAADRRVEARADENRVARRQNRLLERDERVLCLLASVVSSILIEILLGGVVGGVDGERGGSAKKTSEPIAVE
jgi:hypothetical protein